MTAPSETPKLSEYEAEWSKRGYEPHIATLLAKADWSEDMINWQEGEIERLHNEHEAGGSREREVERNAGFQMTAPSETNCMHASAAAKLAADLLVYEPKDTPHKCQDLMRDGASLIESQEKLIGELAEALRNVLETFSLGPLSAASKYGPDVDLRAIEESAVEQARAALAKLSGDGK